MNRTLLALAACLFGATVAEAQVPDHLQCFKIKDEAAKVAYQADLDPTDPVFALATGCTISVPAKLLCVDVVKDNVTPTPPGSPEGTPAQSYLCYKTKCPKAEAEATVTVTDQFGSHPVTAKSTGFACAPIDTVPVPTTTVPTCSDAFQNDSETDVDCGGGTCPECPPGQGCLLASDCSSSFCQAGVCQAPSCSDAVQNASEIDVDCGGGICPACLPGQGCLLASDCSSSICEAGACTPPTCFDAVQNDLETDVDCGGFICPSCIVGQGCALASDCTSNLCSAGTCLLP